MASGADEGAEARNFVAWLFAHADPRAIALLDSDREVSFGALHDRVREVAAFVRERTRGLERPIVPIVGEPTLDWVSAYLGIMYSGAVPAPLPPLMGPAMEHVLRETSAPLVLAADAALTSGSTYVAIRDIPTSSRLETPVSIDPDALALLLYTSGSTGLPRAVMLSTRNLVTNADAIASFCPLTPHDRALVVLPFYYCYGASVLHTHLRAGASLAFPRSGFHADIVEGLERFEVTGLPAVSILIQTLAKRSSLRASALPRLRYVMSSGGALAEQIVRDLVPKLPGVTIYLRYGVTELTAAASYVPPSQLDEKRGSIGRGLPGAPLRVVRPDGSSVSPDSTEVGEIVVGGASVAQGYFADPEETARCFRDGAYHTGDLATLDADGFVFIVGRAKEFVKTSGHRVAPQEVEQVLLEVPGVVEAGVCGVPHPMRGEALAAVVVLDPHHPPSLDAIREHCARRLASHKVPFVIQIGDKLPKTANGKVSRHALSLELQRPTTT